MEELARKGCSPRRGVATPLWWNWSAWPTWVSRICSTISWYWQRSSSTRPIPGCLRRHGHRSELDKYRGVTATLLVQNGTLRRGDTLVVGKTWGRIKAMFDYEGKIIKGGRPQHADRRDWACRKCPWRATSSSGSTTTALRQIAEERKQLPLSPRERAAPCRWRTSSPASRVAKQRR